MGGNKVEKGDSHRKKARSIGILQWFAGKKVDPEEFLERRRLRKQAAKKPGGRSSHHVSDRPATADKSEAGCRVRSDWSSESTLIGARRSTASTLRKPAPSAASTLRESARSASTLRNSAPSASTRRRSSRPAPARDVGEKEYDDAEENSDDDYMCGPPPSDYGRRQARVTGWAAGVSPGTAAPPSPPPSHAGRSSRASAASRAQAASLRPSDSLTYYPGPSLSSSCPGPSSGHGSGAPLRTPVPQRCGAAGHPDPNGGFPSGFPPGYYAPGQSGAGHHRY
ncbi:hypothetical protein GGTG_03589 [Gaeumannomyces tritici R3-111a-1]|uniref:Uncharacterized protein n=1 Tax=Gaeumannomyces tritici (strain R3-111a-1) TaxID=644352 RepID=J3NQN3_GAET3|nr:hypothetical protein GGTG_03589 [Gaeumannomyces tritici R3-111a-1]EJT78489.1 hypothetical protein GGTG_03589 [Gaeumannomyces tritici R3-111a-1]